MKDELINDIVSLLSYKYKNFLILHSFYVQKFIDNGVLNIKKMV